MIDAMDSIVLGGGCFWCLEATYELVRGIEKVVPGYAGGSSPEPTYQSVCTGATGHAEVVLIHFNPTIISLKKILEIFWTVHDPTTPDRQGNDVGTQYRSIILCKDGEQEAIAESSKQQAQKLWDRPIVTEIERLLTFYEAEPEHHNYFKNHPEKAYCQLVINPKLTKLRENFTLMLKDL